MKQIKFIALFLAFIMLLACLPCNAEQDTLPFTDISQDDWFYSDVAFAYENGFVKGKGNNRFAPTENITYAEAIKLACYMHQHIRKKEITLKNGSLVWYSTYLDYAKENSIPYEFENYNTFVTRADFIRIIFVTLSDFRISATSPSCKRNARPPSADKYAVFLVSRPNRIETLRSLLKTKDFASIACAQIGVIIKLSAVGSTIGPPADIE